MKKKKPWKKVLYEKQDYADNYTDTDTFLRDLKKNKNFKDVSFSQALSGAVLLGQEFCMVVAFVIFYVYLYNEWVDPKVIFNYTSLATIIGFIVYRIFFSDQIKLKIGHDFRTVLIFLVFGQIFSPVLHTLTDTVSTDTIYTMTFFMMIVHLIFFDYGVPAAIVSNSLSLSAAVFASVCLASRLSSAYHAFVLITVAVECFVLFPLLRNKIGNSVIVTLLLIIFVTFNLYNLSLTVLLLFILVLFFINVVCSTLFIRYQKYKENIYGPWDEAIIDDVDNFNDLLYS